MKTANVFQIEKALEQPITPQQRQQAAANNPIAALIAQRLDGVEGSLRTKLQTPPPPQGTVMNQYMGLAQPGLEEMAQQYATGGLVAFANGGLASMVPMGYAGEGDVPDFSAVRGYAGGSGVFLDDEYREGFDPSYLGDIGSGVYGLTQEDLARSARADEIIQKREEAERRATEKADLEAKTLWDMRSNTMQPFAPQDVAQTLDPATLALGLKTAPKILSDLGRKTVSEAFSGDSGDKTKPAESGAGSSKEKAVESKPAEGPGTSAIDPNRYRPDWMRASAEAPSATSTPNAEPTIVITDDREAPEHPAVMAPETAQVANSGLSTDKQIAALEKLYAVDTTEAMKIKADWEKANARAGNLGILSALAGAVGLGLGTYGPQSHRIGAGLVGLASGLASNEQQQAARQEKLDNLKMKIAEMEQSPHKKAVETIATEKAKAAARKEEFMDKAQLEAIKGGYKIGAAEIGARGKGDTAGLKKAQIKADIIKELNALNLPPNTPEWKKAYDLKLAQYIAADPTMADILKGLGYGTTAGISNQGASTMPLRGTLMRTGAFTPAG